MKNKSFIIYALIFFILLSNLIPLLAKDSRKLMILEKNTNYSKISALNNQKYNEKFNYGIVKVTEQEIEEIKRDKSVRIREPFKVKVFLDDAISIQNVTNSWQLTTNQINLTGQAQSVCVLDTGADLQHPDLQEKIVAQHCFCASSDCCHNELSEDTNATDDNGHGTHVAGIIAAQGNLLGIANQANLVIVKVLDFEGNGNEIDLINAINWCTENSEEYNISAISLSLGADCDLAPWLCSQNTCEDLSSFLQEEIDSAIAKNISVVIATGNQYNYTHISWPSCHLGVTRVGSSDKTDLNISSFTNRNSLLKLLAVGDSVNSTMPGYNVYLNTEYSYPQNYSEMSGTSMATPMVSGAIAILKQYLSLSSQTKNPSQIETVLNDTGKRIDDSSSGLSYSRIDVYSALLSLDADVPSITINSPQNNSNSNLTYQNFSCNTSDWQLKNITLNVYNSTNLINQTSWSISGKSNSTSLNLTNLNLDGRYYWNYIIYDEKNNVLTTQNYTFYLSNPNVQQISPNDDVYTKVNETYFLCNSSASESLQLSNITFNLYNSGGLVYSNITNLSGTSNSTMFNYTFQQESEYTWNCVVTDNQSRIYNSTNRIITYDATYPDISGTSFIPSYNSVAISWITSESTNSSINLSDSIYNYADFSELKESIISGLNSSTDYESIIFYCDKANNCRTSESFSFTTTSAPVLASGGGGGSTNSFAALNSFQLKSLQEISLEKGKSTKFTLSNKQTHTLRINSLQDNKANITISSNPLNFILEAGQEKKINISSPDFYDLYILLKKISNSKAVLAIQEINESIKPVPEPANPQERGDSESSETNNSLGSPFSIQNENPDKSSQNSNKIKIALVIILVLMILIKVGFDIYNLLKKRTLAKNNKRK